jgi:hypothetical protein
VCVAVRKMSYLLVFTDLDPDFRFLERTYEGISVSIYSRK